MHVIRSNIANERNEIRRRDDGKNNNNNNKI